MEQYFSIIPDNYPDIEVEKIQSLIVDGIEYTKNQFKSMSTFYDFLIENRGVMTYIKYEGSTRYWSIVENTIIHEKYLSNGKLHRLDGPSSIKSTYKDSFSGRMLLEQSVEYYIDNVKINAENFQKHEKVRKAKLERIIYKNDDDNK